MVLTPTRQAARHSVLAKVTAAQFLRGTFRPMGRPARRATRGPADG